MHGVIGILRSWHWHRVATKILTLARRWEAASDEAILDRMLALRWEVKAGLPLRRVMAEVFAITVAATHRELGLRHYLEQIMGAIALFEGHIAEMATGEGKTLTAALPVVLRALPGKGCHVMTANDYLAKRDADLLRPVYERLGLSTGCILPDLDPDERRDHYARDITYGTGAEMGFDFLRDRLRLGANVGDSRRAMFVGEAADQVVQRGHFFALVDEADSLLIDDARTPLIIGLERPPSESLAELYGWSREAATQLLDGQDFVYEFDRRQAWLSELGARRVTLREKPLVLDTLSQEQILEHVEKALVAEYGMRRHRDYVVVDDKISIVSESTGRSLAGRKWQEGLHQSVEAKEGVPLTAPTQTAATITVQSYFGLYRHLCGMTGTATPARAELRRYYRLGVSRIPTHRRSRRTGLPPRIFVGESAKRRAIATAVHALVADGRAVLIGTPSIQASEFLSDELSSEGVSHVVLNALQHTREAQIVAEAGQPGRVTVATNMAGRGTDIKLHPAVAAAGGLHVIATELHSSPRIDRQLIGRAARQGDAGSFQFFLSLEDDLVRSFNPTLSIQWLMRAAPDEKGELDGSWFRVFVRIQREVERREVKLRRQAFSQSRQRMRQHRDAGFDPYLEVTDGS